MQLLNVAGAKARIAPWIVSHLPPHQIYVEPFGGSGAVLMAKPPAKMEVFNDADGGLVHFFQVLAAEPQNLIARVDGLLYSPWRDSRPSTDPVELEARFFLHNNTTWPVANGNSFRRQRYPDKKSKTGRSVAVIFQQRKTLLAQAAARIRHVIFEHGDALKLIARYDGADVLFYIDPPYYGERRSHLYNHEMMDESSHRRLAALVHNVRAAVIVSGYASELYKELYGDWQVVVGHAQTNAKDLRQECLWIKAASGPENRNDEIVPRRRQAREIVKSLIREAAKNPANGEITKRSKRSSKWDRLLWQFLSEATGELRLSDIQSILNIPRRTLFRRLVRWKEKGYLSQNALTKRWQVIKVVPLRKLALSVNGTKKRALENGISEVLQSQLDQIARLRPDLLKRIVEGDLSINAAYRLLKSPEAASSGLKALQRAWSRAKETDRRAFLAEIGAVITMNIN